MLAFGLAGAASRDEYRSSTVLRARELSQRGTTYGIAARLWRPESEAAQAAQQGSRGFDSGLRAASTSACAFPRRYELGCPMRLLAADGGGNR
jgi:hypothetical protein